jgi:hypothetical protein
MIECWSSAWAVHLRECVPNVYLMSVGKCTGLSHSAGAGPTDEEEGTRDGVEVGVEVRELVVGVDCRDLLVDCRALLTHLVFKIKTKLA